MTTPPEPNFPPTAAVRHQFYVTHCVKSDSVLNNPGWSVRAASSDNPTVVRQALEYPPYELPMDLWSRLPTRAQSPRRLARVAAPGGAVWAVHSSYLEKDTMDRDRSYFTHTFLLPAEEATPAAVLESWGSDGWTKEYKVGAAKWLPAPSRVPQGTTIGPEALTAFLSDPNGLPAAELATLICPTRLRADTARRKDLTAQFLAAVTTAVEAEGTPRGRLYVHAEPGLAALLLYAAAKLLPPGWVADLTFTTFEPPHRGLREYKHALVVGTFFGNPAKGLDADLCNTRGFGVDTFHPERSSAPFRSAPHPGLCDLVALAADGEWKLLDRVRELLSSGRPGPERVGVAVGQARALARVDAGPPTIDDLLTLRADPDGAIALAQLQRAERIWPTVREAAWDRPELVEAFRNLFRHPSRLAEVRLAATEAVARDDLGEWDRRWGVVRAVADMAEAGNQLEAVLKEFSNRLGACPAPIRARLRRECLDLNRTAGIEALLSPIGPEDLNDLLGGSGMPSTWRAFAAYRVVNASLRGREAPGAALMRDRVRLFFRAATDDSIAKYLEYARKDTKEDFFSYLDFLFEPHGPEADALLDLLIRDGAKVLGPADWEWIAGRTNILSDPKWRPFLLERGGLGWLMVSLGHTETARKTWRQFLDSITGESLLNHRGNRVIVNQLCAASLGLGPASPEVLPPGGPAKLTAADRLGRMFDDPRSAVAKGHRLREDLKRFWGEPTDGLAAVLARYYGGIDPEDPAFEPFIALFDACYPCEVQSNYTGAVSAWIAISQIVPPEGIARFQAHYFLHGVPVEMWAPLAGALRQEPLAEGVAESLREAAAEQQRKRQTAALKTAQRKRHAQKTARMVRRVGVVVVVVLTAALLSGAAYYFIRGKKPVSVAADLGKDHPVQVGGPTPKGHGATPSKKLGVEESPKKPGPDPVVRPVVVPPVPVVVTPPPADGFLPRLLKRVQPHLGRLNKLKPFARPTIKIAWKSLSTHNPLLAVAAIPVYGCLSFDFPSVLERLLGKKEVKPR